VVCAHRLGVSGRGQRPSTNGRRHQPRHARINRGVCASGKRRRPTAFSINQGLHASVVACAHRLSVTGRDLRASAHACTHQLWHVRIWQTSSANSMQHACTYQSWPMRIGWATSVVTCAHRPTAGEIGQGLHASTVVYTLRLGDIDCDLHASARRRHPNDNHLQPRPARI